MTYEGHPARSEVIGPYLRELVPYRLFICTYELDSLPIHDGSYGARGRACPASVRPVFRPLHFIRGHIRSREKSGQDAGVSHSPENDQERRFRNGSRAEADRRQGCPHHERVEEHVRAVSERVACSDVHHQGEQETCREYSAEGGRLFPERDAAGNPDDGV